MKYQIELISDIWDEILPLLKQFYIESNIKYQGDFNPSRANFEHYERIGAFILVTARFNNVLAGYCGMYITPSMLTQELVATEDSFFVLKKYRSLNLPITAYRYIENQLKIRGVRQITMTTALKINDLMNKLGYNQVANQYTKYLKDGADSAITDKVIGI